MILVILVSLKTIQSLHNGLQPHSVAILSVFIDFNETNIAVLTALRLMRGINGT